MNKKTVQLVYSMYKDLLKISLDVVDNPKTNEDNMRVYRDKSTDQFAAVIFGNKDRMYEYLDYTFHTIYSYLVTKVNRELMALALSDPNNPNVEIKPLCGNEDIIFVFKGGSTMHILYNSYLDALRNQLPNANSDDLIKYFINIKNNQILNYMGINADNYQQHVVDEPNKRSKMKFQYDVENAKFLDKSDNIKDFMDNILKPKFGISDIDYSIYINTDTGSRYIILHGIIVKLLHIILDYITKKFDQHLKNALSNSNNLTKPEIYVESSEIINVYDHPYFLIVRALKMIVCRDTLKKDLEMYDGYKLPSYFNVSIQYTSRFDDINLRDRLVYILNIFNTNMINNTYEKSMYVLYFMLDIVFYSEYIDNINADLLSHKLKLEDIRNYIVINITALVESKEFDLFSIPYYSLSEINQIKKNLAKTFSSLAPDANELKTKIAMRSGSSEPDTYKLVNNTTITESDFEFRPTDCIDIVPNQLAPSEFVTDQQHCNKIHYVTYNAVIRMERGPTILDFDLIRSKINLVMKGSHFIKNDKVVAVMPVPSEFIDISIPRFDDTARINFIDEIRHTGGHPYLLNLKTSTGRQISINSYGPTNIARDLIYILFNQNTFEPWLDKKFQKRIIRTIYFVVLDRVIVANRTNNRIYFDNFLIFLDYCIAIKNHIENPSDTSFWLILEKMVVSKNEVTAEDTLSVLKFYTKNLEANIKTFLSAFTNYSAADLISDDFEDVRSIIISFLFWGTVNTKSNETIKEYINIERSIYKWIPLEPKNEYELNVMITEVRSNVLKLLDTMINIGIKIYYMYATLIDSGQVIKGGHSSRDHQKYLKYKSKYIAEKRRRNMLN